MKTIVYHNYDKADWGDGPWAHEPDKKQWVDEATGYPCMINRAPVTGAWCGYVGVSRGHPLYENTEYDNLPLSVHGGITFASKCQKRTEEDWRARRERFSEPKTLIEIEKFPLGDWARDFKKFLPFMGDMDGWLRGGESEMICHKVEDGEDDDVFWLGFDCAHDGDQSPAMEARMRAIRREEIPSLPVKPDGYERYKDQAYVENEVRDLARQLKEIEHGTVDGG